MKVSLNQIKQFIDFESPSTDELVAKINQQLGGIEEIIDLGDQYKDALIVKLLRVESHPNADRLHVVYIDDNGVMKDIPREIDGSIQVVCGAPNVRENMFAVWLTPLSIVPATYHDSEPFVLGARELRGIMSQGMLAALDELGIGASHDGILLLDENEYVPSGKKIEAGANFAKVFGLDDTIIDIENKMFTHRPDLFGQLGVAREIAGIFGQKFTSPDWYKSESVFESVSGLELNVFNNAEKNVPRFMAVAMQNIEVKPSPLWLQCALVAMGSKPINNIVDVTNYIMLLTAQPVHAYDYDKLRGHTLGARLAKSGEKATLLNDKTYELNETDIVICDGDGIVGLGGVMGGSNSEVSSDTKNIVLEVATFDMYSVRKTSMRHGLFTDAVTRFNKGQSPLQNSNVLNLLMMSIQDVSSAKQASEIADYGQFDDCVLENGIHNANSLGVTAEFINDRLGLNLAKDEIKLLLENVEMHIEIDENGLEVFAPFWRTDIELPEDIVEEVGRLYGFDKLPRELPKRSITPAPKNAMRETKKRLRTSLESVGANELLTYSFVHEKTLKNAEQNSENAYRLSNALSPDLQFYRLSVLPSLLEKVNANLRAGFDEFILYEIGKGHDKRHVSNAGLPREFEMCDVVYASKKAGTGAPFYQLRAIAEKVSRDFGIEFRFVPAKRESDGPLLAPFELSRSAFIETIDGKFLGVVGELKPSVRRAFKLPEYSAALSFGLEGLERASAKVTDSYQPLSKYPSVTQDISLQVSREVRYGDIFELAAKTAASNSEYSVHISPLSIYQADGQSDVKTVTLHITVTSHERTLEESDVTALLDEIASAANREFQAEKV